MLMQADVGKPFSAHVIVLGNEKGGSGKSTTAMHVAVALLQAGQRVATIDLDSRQKSFTHYVENRRDWAERARIKLEMPVHYCVARGFGLRLDEIEAQEFAAFAEAVSAVENSHDFVVIDTPGTDSYLMRLAHSMADTLITPLNDSFVDFDVLGTVDPTTFEVVGVSHYAEMVREARRQRRLVDGGLTDWVVVRNRLSTLGSRNKRLVGEGVDRARQAARLSRHRRICRAGGLPRVFPARAHRARRPQRGHARPAPHRLARDGARRGQSPDRGAEAADRRARQAPRRGPRRMARGFADKPLETHDLLAD